MTERKPYTLPMNTSFPLRLALLVSKISTLLLNAHTVGGIFALFFLFILSFLCVHILKCAKVGFLQSKKPEVPPKEEKAPAPPQEPVYYIVEKKRTRAKPKYGEPKQIHFK